MKLNIVPARTGILWVKLGIQTFMKQPLALTGLFFMYMAAVLVLSQVPVLGPVLGSMLVPAATLGLMAATAEAASGRFPMPTVLISAFRAGKQRARAVMVIGAVYFVAFLLWGLLASSGMAPAAEAAPPQMRMSPGLLVAAFLQVPMIIIFSLAPALVHWHEVGAIKSLFFSAVALWKNLGAFVVFVAVWLLVVFGAMAAVGLVLGMFGIVPTVQTVSPLLLLVATMMTCSLYFTFRDSFQADVEEPVQPDTAEGGDQA